MLICLETTVWRDENENTPNSIYALSKGMDKLLGYVAFGTDQWKWFKTPLNFSAKNRKFTVLEEREDPVQGGQEWKVPSSSKGSWTVRLEDGEWSCDCPASKFRHGECKHIKTIQKQLT